MGSHRRIAASAIALVLLGTTVSCRSRNAGTPSPSASIPSGAKPLDRLAPGELAPGKDEAFDLVLPRGLEIEAHFEKTVHARGPLKPEDVTRYIKERIDVRYVELRPEATVFPRAHVKGGRQDRVLTIEVIARLGGTELVIRDATPIPKPPPGLTEAQLMERAGLTPDGKVKNLDKLE